MRGEDGPGDGNDGDAGALARSAAALGIVLPDDWTEIAGPDAGTAEEPAGIAVWPDHWDAARLVAALASQWRVIVGGDRLIWLGLDYAAVEVTARLMGITATPDTFRQVQQMEGVILPLLNRR
ncbi:MAG: DUF1799 domain-containing protein [Hyphomicrobiaceae bacterium]|nr:DUF1799 domain-containing protein [Hyphomicrobiaceae bacterium]